MHNLLSLVIGVLFFTSASAAGKIFLDADSFSESIGMVAGIVTKIEEERVYCGEEFPDRKSSIDRAAFTWKLNNKSELTAYNAYVERNNLKLDGGVFKITSEFSNHIRGLTENRDGICSLYSARTSGRISQETPIAARFLNDYLKANPLTESEAKRRDSNIGCMKAGINDGADYDGLLVTCKCAAAFYSAYGEFESFYKYIAKIESSESVSSIETSNQFIKRDCSIFRELFSESFRQP
ncbi:hypothetical protein ACFL53_04670 [Pseudomonadota bacterium]